MEYRSYRDTDCRPSLLGLGCMRLPTLEPGGTAIDYARAGALVDEACLLYTSPSPRAS